MRHLWQVFGYVLDLLDFTSWGGGSSAEETPPRVKDWLILAGCVVATVLFFVVLFLCALHDK